MRRLDPAVLGWAGLLTALVLAPVWLGRGFVLSYDLVAVPQQRLQPWMWGGGQAPPRAVPQDVLVSLLDDVVPGALLQRLLLTAALFGAGAGIARLAAPHGRVGQVVAVSAYAWSAYVYERLVIGHWGLVLAYAALPWLVATVAAARQGDRRGPALAVLVVAAGTWVPTGGALLAAVAIPLLLWPGAATSLRPRLIGAVGVLAVQLTWVVPGILTATTSAAAPQVFGLRADGVLEALVAALGGDGIWSPRASPASRGGPLALVAAAVVVVALVAGLPGVRRGLGARSLTPLLLVSLALGAWAIATALAGAAPVVEAVQALPGAGLLRDAQKWLAPWWLVCSLAFGATARRLQAGISERDSARVLPFAMALVPLVLLPDLALGALGRLTPARYPQGWESSRAALAAAADRDLVVTLPWSAFRRFAWNHDRVVLDPAPRYLPRTVVGDTTLLVMGPEQRPVTVPGDDLQSREVEQALRSADPVGALRAVGVGWVLVEVGQPAAPGAPPIPDLRATTLVVATSELELRRIPGAVATPATPRAWPVLIAWIVLGAVLLGAVVGMSRATRTPGAPGGDETRRDV